MLETTLKRCAVCQNWLHCTATGYCNCGAYSVRQDTTTGRYALETHADHRQTPIAIWEMKDGKAGRCVANLKTDAQPTLEEARAMVTALNNIEKQKAAPA